MSYIIGLDLNEQHKHQKLSIQKPYKLNINDIYRMYPNDPIGPLDDFLSINYLWRFSWWKKH